MVTFHCLKGQMIKTIDETIKKIRVAALIWTPEAIADVVQQINAD